MTTGLWTGLLTPDGARPAVAVAAALLVAAAAAVLGVGSGAMLRRLPEPGPDHPGLDPDKVTYASLAGRRFRLRSAAAAGLTMALAVLTVPVAGWPPWFVLATAVVLLAGIDAATTWLPWRLTWVAGVAMLAAGGMAGLLGTPATALLRLLLGAAVAFGWYLLIYLLSRRRLGVGDIWLAALVGAPTALVGWGCLYWAVFLGAVIGGLQGMVLVLRGHRGGFAYAPAIVAGAVLAPLVGPLVRALGG